ncbi:MAG: hypothetical protein IJW75_05520 [Alphaproteobacteria bacterium]|nr:hypothetical protein [Alphaproteobacteria bacterium]
MKKILILTLCCFMYANVAYDKVCFLADPDCDIGIREANTGKPGGGGSDPTPDNKTYCRDEPDYNKWVPSSRRCSARKYELACSDDVGGDFYRDLGCDNSKGYYDVNASNNIFNTMEPDENNTQCDCAPLVCKNIFRPCGLNQTGREPSCEDAEGKKYRSCYCDRDIYKFDKRRDCERRGMVSVGECCTHGANTYCEGCVYDNCKDLGSLWIEEDEIPDGQTCDREQSIELVDGSYLTCYTDCHDSCELATQEKCEEKYANAICVKGYDNCWERNRCKDGFEEINGECTCKYTSKEACEEEAGENFVCSPNEVGCYHPDGCDEGYRLVDGVCVQDTKCEYADETDCESTNYHSDCTLVDGCYEPTACKTPYVDSVTKCGTQGAKGYELVDVVSGCGRCEAKECITKLTEFNCKRNNGAYSKPEETGEYSGDKPCLKCACDTVTADQKCTWTNSNKGSATITNKCCNEKYSVCTSTCEKVTVPENAHSTATCTGCGETVATAWECDSSYTKVGDECVAQSMSICNVGDIVYTDKTCTSPDKYNANKTPVGIVFYVDASGTKGKIISLDYMINPDSQTQNYMTFGYFGTDIDDITNYTLPELYDALKENKADLFNGRAQTKIISEAKPSDPTCDTMDETEGDNMTTHGYSASCRSISVATILKFYPHETVKKDAEIGMGKWYMPSAGDALQMCGELPSYKPSSTSDGINLGTTTYDKLQAAFKAILAKLDKDESEKTQIEKDGNVFRSNTSFWLTTEKDKEKQYTLSARCKINNQDWGVYKNHNGYTRAIAEVTFKKK